MDLARDGVVCAKNKQKEIKGWGWLSKEERNKKEKDKKNTQKKYKKNKENKENNEIRLTHRHIQAGILNRCLAYLSAESVLTLSLTSSNIYRCLKKHIEAMYTFRYSSSSHFSIKKKKTKIIIKNYRKYSFMLDKFRLILALIEFQTQTALHLYIHRRE